VRKGEARASPERARGNLTMNAEDSIMDIPSPPKDKRQFETASEMPRPSNGAPELPSRLKNAPTARAPGSIDSRSGCATKSKWLRSSAMRRKAWRLRPDEVKQASASPERGKSPPP